MSTFCQRFGLSEAAEVQLALALGLNRTAGLEPGNSQTLQARSHSSIDRPPPHLELVKSIKDKPDKGWSDSPPEAHSGAVRWSSSGGLVTMYAQDWPSEPPDDEQDPAANLRFLDLAADRYVDLGIIGRGGMGEVRRVQDRDLNRVLAMKVILPEALHNATLVSRFIQEAQVIAQLDHPGIVPAYELGRLPDGRIYFTMKEVRGRTLSAVIAEVHAASTGGRWRAGRSGWTFWRLIDAFCTICKAVAYAHACDIIHRDLKPSNIMVGAFGEVLVMDWGLARVLREPERTPGGAPPVNRMSTGETLYGSVSGTPAYMPPEQARGLIDQLGPPSDVYALGAILYEILTGHPPYQGLTTRSILEQVLAGPPPPPQRVVRSVIRGRPNEAPTRGAPPVPESLWDLCQKAMSANTADRYANGGVLAVEIGAWLEGDKERGRASEIVARAEALLPGIAGLRADVGSLRSRANALLERVKPSDPVEVKRPGWALLDQATRLERDADLKEIEYIQLLRAALASVPELPEAHARLAEHYHARHVEAETRRDTLEAARLEAMLRTHDDGTYGPYLAGEGKVTLLTDPPGAEVALYRYVERDRRLVPHLERVLGRTPLREIPLPRGSYLLTVRAEGRIEVRYPVYLGRQVHWDCVPPGSSAPQAVPLPIAHTLGPNDLYVPAGHFNAGGDPETASIPAARLWADGFVMQRFPITNWEYIAFLDDLVAHGREEDALRFAPRERAGAAAESGAMLYGRDARGRFALRPDEDGDLWQPDWPVVNLDWESALGYAAWWSDRTGQPWRLPFEMEWEKAARGVDGRFFPWGDFLDPTWCRMRDSLPGRGLPAVVDSYPVDESPYGVRGLAGNTRDWCMDTWRPEGPRTKGDRVIIDPAAQTRNVAEFRTFRGGAWNNPSPSCRSAYRSCFRPHFRYPVLGLRLAHSYTDGIAAAERKKAE